MPLSNRPPWAPIKPMPSPDLLAELDRLNKDSGNILDGTFNRAAYEKALSFYRWIFHGEAKPAWKK